MSTDNPGRAAILIMALSTPAGPSKADVDAGPGLHRMSGMNVAREPVSFTRGAPQSHSLSQGSPRWGSLRGRMPCGGASRMLLIGLTKCSRLAGCILGVLGVVSGVAAADILDSVTRVQPGATKRFSSGLFDPESNADAYHAAPGQRLTVAELDGPGEIRHIWFTVASQERRWPRALVLRIFWDGAETPSVETPIGDFFCGRPWHARQCQHDADRGHLLRPDAEQFLAHAVPQDARIEVWNQSTEPDDRSIAR